MKAPRSTILSAVVLLCSFSVIACSGGAEDRPGGLDSGTGGHATATGGSSTGGHATATGGQTTGGSSASGGVASGGNGGGSGGTTELPDACEASEWTCVPVDIDQPYGEKTITVPAKQNWVNTGIYLKKDQTATFEVSGNWNVTGTGSSIDHGSCKVGDFVARIGLHYKDTKLTCVNGTGSITADKDGILFVGALAGNDLGETYETRSNDSGEKSVKVQTSTGSPAPSIDARKAADFPYDDVTAGQVEILGEHVILTLPLATAKADKATLLAATNRLDAIYELEEELRGAVPHAGQRLRFFPDGTQPGYMLAGNPIRMDLSIVDPSTDDSISRAGEEGVSNWGYAHEMGHDFSFAPTGFWTYQEDTLESWCNLFSLYSLESLGLEINNATASCTSSTVGDYDSGNWDAWEGLCFLRQFQFDYGWDFYKAYFRDINDETSTGGNAWNYVHNKFETIAGQDVTPIFTSWKVPHP